jgi:hypothetical protein
VFFNYRRELKKLHRLQPEIIGDKTKNPGSNEEHALFGRQMPLILIMAGSAYSFLLIGAEGGTRTHTV